MAYRRRQGIARSTTFREDFVYKTNEDDNENSNSFYQQPPSTASSDSLAAQAIKASSVHRHSSSEPRPSSKVFEAYEDTGRDASGFWGVLARKAKAIIDEDTASPKFTTTQPRSSRFQMSDSPPAAQSRYSNPTNEAFGKVDNPVIRKGLDRITSSLNQIGDSFEKAFEEGRTMVGNRTADLKLQIKRKGSGLQDQTQSPRDQMTHETQLKASRDVAMATAAKAKLLLRELKSVKADLAFAKLRCTQLEEENKILRESRDKGGNPADDDMIRLQLEALLAEKGRLAHENSIYARENRFLREIVEYHQLTMQDVVYLDEGNEEVTEVNSLTKMLSISPPSPASPSDTTYSLSSQQMKDSQREPDVQEETHQVPDSEGQSPRDEDAPETEAEVPATVSTNKVETARNTPKQKKENAQMTSQASK